MSRLAHFRKLKGISQELLAENSGISLRTIQRIEMGAVSPRGHTMKTLAETLNISLAELTEETDKPVESSPVDFDKLKTINFAALSGLIMPLANIMVPLILWRNSSRHFSTDVVVKKIIHFQILWTVFTATILFVVPLIQYSIVGAYVIGRFPPTVVMTYVAMLMCNLSLTIRTTRRLDLGDTNIYSFVPTLF